MLAALREVRSGDKKKKRIEDGDGDDDARPVIGPLMGPTIKDDISDASAPSGFAPPDPLEFVGLETDLPVGYLRLRWALLHSSSKFMKEAFLADVMKYDKIEMGQWSVHENEIGLPKTDGIDEASFVNATLGKQVITSIQFVILCGLYSDITLCLSLCACRILLFDAKISLCESQHVLCYV